MLKRNTIALYEIARIEIKRRAWHGRPQRTSRKDFSRLPSVLRLYGERKLLRRIDCINGLT